MDRRWLAAVACVSLTACGPFIPIIRLSDLPAGEHAAIARVRSYQPSELAVLRYTTIAAVEGFSCKGMLWSPDASEEDAVQQLKYWALQKGANGIAELKCDPIEGASLNKNCWETIRCTARAIKVGG